ncbi:MAG: tetratricopeptide repeat protein [Myxococcota bacterium]
MREFQLAASLREENNTPGALDRLRRALELDPENARAYVLRGFIYFEGESYPEAEADLRKGVELLELRPDMASVLAEARNLLGLALANQEKYTEALELLRTSADDPLNTAPWVAWGNLGWTLYRAGEHEESEAALQEAVRNQPRYCLGFYWLGQTQFAMEKLAEAEASLTQAVEADERCGRYLQSAYKLRGETRARLGNRDAAVADFERCVELSDRTDDGQACNRFLGMH